MIFMIIIVIFNKNALQTVRKSQFEREVGFLFKAFIFSINNMNDVRIMYEESMFI